MRDCAMGRRCLSGQELSPWDRLVVLCRLAVTVRISSVDLADWRLSGAVLVGAGFRMGTCASADKRRYERLILPSTGSSRRIGSRWRSETRKPSSGCSWRSGRVLQVMLRHRRRARHSGAGSTWGRIGPEGWGHVEILAANPVISMSATPQFGGQK